MFKMIDSFISGTTLVINIVDCIIMVAVWNRADHYIFALWFLLSFFPRLISAVRDRMDVCHISTHHVALVRL